MHKPSEPESLRREIAGEGDAPCNCVCSKGTEPGTEQPLADRAAVDFAVENNIGGKP